MPTQPGVIDQFEAHLERAEPVQLPLTHRFTPGLYIREVLMPAGVLVTTPIHLYEHPFVISKGVVDVYVEGVGVTQLQAPYTGVTPAGTRRLLYVREETIWTTFHVTELTDVQAIEAMVTQVPVNPLLPGGYRNVEYIRCRQATPTPLGQPTPTDRLEDSR